MYKVLSYCVQDSEILYAVQDTETSAIEVVDKSDLVLLLAFGVELFDLDNSRVRLGQSNTILGNIDDATNTLDIEDSDEYDEYDVENFYDEYVDSVDDEYFDEDNIDDVDDYYDEYDYADEYTGEDSDVESLVKYLARTNSGVDGVQSLLNKIESETEDISLDEALQQLEAILDSGSLDDYASDCVINCLNSYYSESESEDNTDYYDEMYAFDDEEEEESVVGKLYELLNAEQKDVLRRYYLWYSRRLFENEQNKTGQLSGFKIKSNMIRKQNQLKTLRGDAQYFYAGFIDMGWKGGGFCDLGHPLRYLHLAWDITKEDIDNTFFSDRYKTSFDEILSSPYCIQFGIKCIGDFFEVDSECIRALQSVQRDSLKDMSEIYEYYMDGDVQPIKDSFQLMDTVVDKISMYDIRNSMGIKGYIPIIPLALISLYKRFREVDMIVPKSLIRELRSCIVGWAVPNTYTRYQRGTLPMVTSKFVKDILPIVAGKDCKGKLANINIMRGVEHYSYSSLDNNLISYIQVMFAYEICGKYKFTGTKEGEHGEWGYSKIKVTQPLNTLYYNASFGGLIKDAHYDIDTLKHIIDIVFLLSDYNTNYKSSTFTVYSDKLDEDVTYYIGNSNFRGILDEYLSATGDDIKGTHDRLQNIIKVLNYGTRFSSVDDYFKPYIQNKILIDLAGLHDAIVVLYADTVRMTTELISFCKSKNADARKAKEEADALAQQELEQEAQRKDELKSIDTPKKVIEYLSDKDLTAYATSMKFSLGVKLVNQLSASDYEPSSKQFYHIQRLFEDFTGTKYSGGSQSQNNGKMALTDDFKVAINYILQYPNMAKEVIENMEYAQYATEEKVLGVGKSVLEYGSISKFQMNYIQGMKVVYDKYNI